MTISFSLKKVVATAALTAPLGLALVACGSGDDEAETTSASTVTSTASTTKATTSTTPTTEAEPSPSDAPQAEAEHRPADQPVAQPNPAILNPFEGQLQPVPESQPIEGGPGSEADAAEISQLLDGFFRQPTLHALINYMPDHMCAASLEKNGGRQSFDARGIPDADAGIIPGYHQSRVTDVSDLRVNGDQASARITVSNPETGDDTQTMRFAREGGTWRFCP